MTALSRLLVVLFAATVGSQELAGLQSLPCMPAWKPVPLPTEAHLYGVAHGGGHWVAVGEGGTVVVSQDLSSWHVVDPGVFQPLRGAAWGLGGWVVVGDGGVVLRGEDPFHLSVAAANLGSRLNAVAWSGQRFLAGGARSDEPLRGLLATSINGISWETTTPEGLLPLYGVFAQEGNFHGVGWGGSWVSSPDAVHWEVTSLAPLMHQCAFMLRPSFLYAIAATPARTVTVGLVVGDQYPGIGVSLAREGEGPWRCALTELPPSPFRFYSVTTAGDRFVAAGLGGVATSRDGLQWVEELGLPGVTLSSVATAGETWVAVGIPGVAWVRHCYPTRTPRRVFRPQPPP